MAVPETVRDAKPSEAKASDSEEARNTAPTPIRPASTSSHEPTEGSQPAEGFQSAEGSNPAEGSHPAKGSRSAEGSRTLVIALGVLLAVLLLTLLSQIRANAVLENQVSLLESEVATAQDAVSRYQARFELVRDEVGELVTRVGGLSRLVTVPIDEKPLAAAESEASTVVGVVGVDGGRGSDDSTAVNTSVTPQGE